MRTTRKVPNISARYILGLASMKLPRGTAAYSSRKGEGMSRASGRFVAFEEQIFQEPDQGGKGAVVAVAGRIELREEDPLHLPGPDRLDQPKDLRRRQAEGHG